MNWFYLIVAGLLEIVWAYYMKQSAGFTKLIPTILTIVSMTASFGLLQVVMRTVPLGIAYTIWTGIGAVGAFIVGIIFLGEDINAIKVIAGVLIIAGLVLIKLSSTH